MTRTEHITRPPARTAADLPPLSEAKLAAPRLRAGLLERARIVHALDAAETAALTLVAAPAGYGKTTAVRAWCASRGAPVAWVTLDAGDDDAIRLWTYVASAVDRVREGLGRGALHRLRIPDTSLDAVVDELTNGIAAFGRELVIVLDELESVTDAEGLGSLDRAVARLPSNARLVLVTRSDPPLSLARLRVRGELVELRASELAFTASEARALVGARANVQLDDAELEMLIERTEGWPAALELVALWLRDAEDAGQVVREFTGDHRVVAAFLSHEVLGALDDDLRSFLLRASVLGRFTSQLCDAVLARTDSTAVLAALERSNLFVSRLEHGGWYRVHPLFAEFARFQLALDAPDEAAALHQAAAEWFVQHGFPVDAAVHAAAAGDVGLVARLLVRSHLALMRGGSAATLLHWVRSLPDEQILEHPELAGAAAIAAAMLGHRTVERHRFLRLADRSLAERPERSTTYSRAVAETARASSVDGQHIEEAVESGRLAVELSERGADEALVAALGGYARALYFAGDLDGAWRAAMRAVEHPDAEHRPPGHAFARSTLAFVAADRGRLDSARVHAEKARAIMGGVGTSRSWLGANASAALGLVHLESGRLIEAERELASAEHFFVDEVASVHHAWLLLLLGRARCRRGRLEAAERALHFAAGEIDELGGPPTVAALAAALAEELAEARRRTGDGEPGELPSKAELAVLRLLASDLSTRQIGTQLFLSPNTVRSHTRAIYRKLGVNARVDAVARAEALGLLADSDSPR